MCRLDMAVLTGYEVRPHVTMDGAKYNTVELRSQQALLRQVAKNTVRTASLLRLYYSPEPARHNTTLACQQGAALFEVGI